MWVLLAMVIGSATAAITEPVDPNEFYDVFARGEQVPVAEDSGVTSCTLSCPDASTCSSTSWSQAVPLSGGTGTYTLQTTDPTGKYRLTCGTFTQDFFVRASHQRLWLDHNPPSAIAADYVRNDPLYLDDSRRFDPPPNNSVAAWDPLWVPDTGWDWVMNVRVPRYSVDGSSTAIPQRAGSSATASLFPASILASSDTAELKKYLYYIEDLGLTALTYDAYTTSYAATKGDTSYFEKSTHTPYFWPAFEYWGQQLVTHSAAQDWTTYSPWTGDRDLIRAHLVLAMAVSYDWAYPKLSLAERRQWRKQLAEEVGELVTDYPAPSRYETFDGVVQANRTKKRLLSGHAFQIQAAVGAGTAVLYRELSSGAWSTDRDAWTAEAEDFYIDFLWAAGSDGAVHKGFLYFQTDLEMFLRYVEALRVSPEWTASTIDSTWYGTWAHYAPDFLRHQTPYHSTLSLTRQRPAFGDGDNEDWNGPSYLLARIADQENLPSAQRHAWFGHNPRSFGTSATSTRRDTLDILWWDDSLAPESDTTALAAPTARCHGDLGVVSLRSSWSASDSVHLVYRGGRAIGNHDYPDVGAFTLWRDGWLVTAAGRQPTSGRTATSAALLIDGQGQHHDGSDTNQQVPEVSTLYAADDRNNSRLVGYFDNNATSLGGQAIDVVTVATDLTQLYRTTATTGSTSIRTRTWRPEDVRRCRACAATSSGSGAPRSSSPISGGRTEHRAMPTGSTGCCPATST